MNFVRRKKVILIKRKVVQSSRTVQCIIFVGVCILECLRCFKVNKSVMLYLCVLNYQLERDRKVKT